MDDILDKIGRGYYPYDSKLRRSLAQYITRLITDNCKVNNTRAKNTGNDNTNDGTKILNFRSPYTGATILHILLDQIISYTDNEEIVNLIKIFPFSSAMFNIQDNYYKTCLHVLFLDHKCNSTRDLVDVVTTIAPHLSPAHMMMKDKYGNTVWHSMFSRMRDSNVFKHLAHLFSVEALSDRNNFGQTTLFVLFSSFKYGDNEAVVNMIIQSLGDRGICQGDMRARENEEVHLKLMGYGACCNTKNDTVWHTLFHNACHYPSAFAVLKKLVHLLTPADMRAVNANGETCWHKLFWVNTKSARDTIKFVAGLPPVIIHHTYYSNPEPVEWLTRDDLVQRSHENESCVDLLMYEMNATKFEVFQFIEELIFGSVELSDEPFDIGKKGSVGSKRTSSEVTDICEDGSSRPVTNAVEGSVSDESIIVQNSVRDVFRHRRKSNGYTGAHYLRQSKNEYSDRVFNRILPFLDLTIKNNTGETVMDMKPRTFFIST